MAKKNEDLTIVPAEVDTIKVTDTYGESLYVARTRAAKVTTITIGDPESSRRVTVSDGAFDGLLAALTKLRRKK